jgi:hypothetical protein
MIYLDTNLWNRLFDHKINPKSFLKQLKGKNANLVVSGQTIYELAKTFSGAPQRAQQLFQYLKLYVDAGIIGAHDNMEQLRGELAALDKRTSSAIVFYGPREYREMQSEVNKLAQGNFDERAKFFTTERQQFSQTTRADQKAHFDTKQHVKDELKGISEDQLERWLDNQVISHNGAAMLTIHLQRMYSDVPMDILIAAALALLRTPASRIAKGIVRADLYFNWRCANRESTPRDLVDDMYHVLNASYCATYATAEPKQTEYASLLLSTWTKIAVYDDEKPVNSWLSSLA